MARQSATMASVMVGIGRPAAGRNRRRAGRGRRPVGAPVAVDGAVDGGGRVAEVTDQPPPEGDDVVLALAARSTVADEDQRPGSFGFGGVHNSPGTVRPSRLDVETALADAFGDVVVSGPVHRSRVTGTQL